MLVLAAAVAAAPPIAAPAATAAGAAPDRQTVMPGALRGAEPIAEAGGAVRPPVAAAAARLRAAPEAQRLAQLRQLAPQLPNPLLVAELAEIAASFPEGGRLDALGAVLPAVPARLEAADVGRLVAGLPDRDRPAALRMLVPRAERLAPAEAAALLGPLRDRQRLDGLNAVLARLPPGDIDAGQAAPLLGPGGAPPARVSMLTALVPRLAPSSGGAMAGLLDGLRDADRANALLSLAQRIARPLPADAALRLLDGIDAPGPRLQAVRAVAPLLGRVPAADAGAVLGPLRDDARSGGLVALADKVEAPVDGAALGPLLGDEAGPARLRGLQALAPRLALTPAQAADLLRGFDGAQRAAALPLVLERTSGDADPMTVAELVRGLDPVRAGRQAALVVRAWVAEPGRLAPALAALPPEARQSFLEQLAASRDAPRLSPADARAALEALPDGQRAGLGRPLLALLGPGAATAAADLGALLDAVPPEQRAAAAAGVRQWPPMGLAERAALLARFPAGWGRDEAARRLPEPRPAETRMAPPGVFAVPACEGLVAFGERLAEPVAVPGAAPSAAGGALASGLPASAFGTPASSWSPEQVSAIAAAAAVCRPGLAGLRDAARSAAALARLDAAALGRQVAFLRERDAALREMAGDPGRLAASPEGDALLDAAEAALSRLDRWGGALPPEERRRHEEALRPGVERAAAPLRRRVEAETADLPATLDGLKRLGAAYDRLVGPRAALEARAGLTQRFAERVEALAGPALPAFEAELARLPASGEGLARAAAQVARPGGATGDEVPDEVLDRFRPAAARRAAAIAAGLKAAACGDGLARAGLGGRDRGRPVLLGEGTAPLGEWLCGLDERGLRLARSEAPGLFGGAHVLVFDLGGGVPLRLSLREAEDAQRVRGLAAAAAGDGATEHPVALAAWLAAARDPAALAGLGGVPDFRPHRPPEPGSLEEAVCPAHDRALAAARALDRRLGADAGPDRVAEPFLREVVEPLAEALGGALRQVEGRLAQVDNVAAARAGDGRQGPRADDAAALMVAQGLTNLFGGAAPILNTVAADCGAKLRVPFVMGRRGGDAAAAPRDALAVPGAAAAGKRVWIWGAGEVAPREEWRRQIEAQVLAPLRVASSALVAPAQPQRAGSAERGCLELLARLHGPTGRPLLLLKAAEVFPAAP